MAVSASGDGAVAATVALSIAAVDETVSRRIGAPSARLRSDTAHRLGPPGDSDSEPWRGTALRVLSVDEYARADDVVGRFARYPDPALRVDARRVDVRATNPAVRQAAARLRATRRRLGAVGLAATQCGVDAAMVALGDDVYCNPVITARSPESEMLAWRETCLVLPPDVVVETLRDRWITVEAQGLEGRRVRRTFVGEVARAMQHEMDHMHGVLIIDHAADLDRDVSRLFPRLADLERPAHGARRARAWARETSHAYE
mmetsp:Transcript_15205/g.61116  ORF Transcript_15205/g.61116 Transcript_15205/m.61116 type:complete len:259 (-) Transcript_15205:63-839(-)